MDPSPVNWSSLAALYLLLLLPAILFRYYRLDLGRDLLLSSARMTLQLLLVGLYLGWLFRYDKAWLNLLWLAAMLVAATHAITGRTRLPRQSLWSPALLGLLLSTLLVLPPLLLTLQASPLLSSRYLIPLSGMLLGNAMGAVVVALERLFSSLEQAREEYAARLALGATVAQALRPYQQQALRAAFMPQLASMATIGLVTLPGMMTGQLLSGTAPVTAIQYQMAIMVGIFCCLSLAVWVATSLALWKLVDRNGSIRVSSGSGAGTGSVFATGKAKKTTQHHSDTSR